MALTAIRFADGSDDIVEGLGIPFGGPFGAGQDLYGEHFSKATDFALSWFPEENGRPALFHHSLDSDVGLAPVGRVKSYEVKADLGVWTKVQLDKSSEYFGAIKEMVKTGKLFFSSGAMAHLVEVDKRSGEIKRWPWVELSLTPTPANLLATVDLATASRHYKSAGMELPEAVRANPEPDPHATPVASRGQGLLCLDSTKAVNEKAFWSHVNKSEGEDAHWLWTGAKNTKGYGILEVDGATVRAHRVAYEMAHGPIPEGKDVGHKSTCATTSCVRASHLELVTNDENAEERAEREAAQAAKAAMDAGARNQLSDADFAYIDADGGRHLPINDEAHVRNAIARFGQTKFESDEARAKARARILAAAKKLGIEVSEDSLKAVTMAQMKKMAADLDMDMTPAEMQKMIDAFPGHDEEAMRKALAARKQMAKSVGLRMSMMMMKQMAADMGMEMSEADMKQMMADHPDASEEDMRKIMQQKKAGKSASLRADDSEVPAEDQAALDKLADYIAALTDIGDADLADMDKAVLDGLIEMADELIEPEQEATKAGGHSGHGGAHSSHGGAGPIAKGAAKKRVLGALEKKASAVLTELRNVRKMKLTSPRGAEMRREIIKGAQTELAGIRKKMVAARAKYKSAPALKAVSWESIRQECGHMLDQMLALANTNPFTAPESSIGYCYVEETCSDHVIARVCHGGQERYFSVPFTLGADGHVASMGEPTEVEETYIPVKPGGPMANMPMAMHAETIRAYAASLLERTKDLQQRRLKEGRVISGTNRKRLNECVEAMNAAVRELQGLLDSTEPQPAKAASVRRLRAQLVAQHMSALALN